MMKKLYIEIMKYILTKNIQKKIKYLFYKHEEFGVSFRD